MPTTLIIQESMAPMNIYTLFSFLIIIILSAILQCLSQPQNIQTFYPFALPPLEPPRLPVQPPSLPPSPPPPPLLSPPPSSKKKAVGTAIGVTAAGVLVLSGIVFFLLGKCRMERGSAAAANPYTDPYPSRPADLQDEFMRFGGKIKGVIVDEEGLDVLYWRNLENGDANGSFFKKQVFSSGEKVEENKIVIRGSSRKKPATQIQETPLLRGQSSSSQHPSWSEPQNIELARPASDQPSANGKEQVKWPLHQDKLMANAGSSKFDGDLMEALFGYVATHRKSPKRDTAAQIFILETSKSQNIAIVLKSLGVTHKEIIDALNEGEGLSAETLEKLCQVAPTREEESEILNFVGDSTRLADTESFLFHILKAIPSAFSRFNTMLFRSNYSAEIHHLNESLLTLEQACNELRGQRLVMKLVEAVLKAGNRMNAQYFNLTALRKLSDVKSIDGKTTLLQFVVQEVVRAEGKRCVSKRNIASSDYDKEKEYIILGLPVFGGLSSELSNVKKAATIDCDSLSKTCLILSSQAYEIRKLVAQCGADGGGFATKMKKFLHDAEGEIKAAREEEIRVMELVKGITDYYQAGASHSKTWQPLQLFVIIRDFLGMVDRACVEIARNLQNKKLEGPSAGSSSLTIESQSRAVRFPKLPVNFMSEQ